MILLYLELSTQHILTERVHVRRPDKSPERVSRQTHTISRSCLMSVLYIGYSKASMVMLAISFVVRSNKLYLSTAYTSKYTHGIS